MDKFVLKKSKYASINDLVFVIYELNFKQLRLARKGWTPGFQDSSRTTVNYRMSKLWLIGGGQEIYLYHITS